MSCFEPSDLVYTHFICPAKPTTEQVNDMRRMALPDFYREQRIIHDEDVYFCTQRGWTVGFYSYPDHIWDKQYRKAAHDQNPT